MRRILMVAGLVLVAFAVQAADIPEYRLVISNHRYEPTELKVPAGVKFKLLVENRDSTPEEFESNEFNREKIILPHSTAQIFVGPLAPGRYKFFGDFHQDTAQGALVVE
ncbi:MAG TPA: cupredoxin domain-containing protein [Rhodanobacter sp.]